MDCWMLPVWISSRSRSLCILLRPWWKMAAPGRPGLCIPARYLSWLLATSVDCWDLPGGDMIYQFSCCVLMKFPGEQDIGRRRSVCRGGNISSLCFSHDPFWPNSQATGKVPDFLTPLCSWKSPCGEKRAEKVEVTGWCMRARGPRCHNLSGGPEIPDSTPADFWENEMRINEFCCRKLLFLCLSKILTTPWVWFPFIRLHLSCKLLKTLEVKFKLKILLNTYYYFFIEFDHFILFKSTYDLNWGPYSN